MRYFFDSLVDDIFVRDTEGRELASLDAAKREAVRVLTELARYTLPESESRTLVVEVRDRTGGPFMTASLGFEMQVLRSQRKRAARQPQAPGKLRRSRPNSKG